MPVRIAVWSDEGWPPLQTYDLACLPDKRRVIPDGSILRGALKFMNIESLINRHWYLAQYITTGKKRESLFSWLSSQHVVPWTPLIKRKVRRADSPSCYRQRVHAIFPGYFFMRADFNIQSASRLRQHSAFIDFVKFDGTIKPVNNDIVDGLMKIYPDPVLNPGAREELDAAPSIWLTKAQYKYLLRMENNPLPESRISLLLELVSNAANHGFMERLP